MPTAYTKFSSSQKDKAFTLAKQATSIQSPAVMDGETTVFAGKVIAPLMLAGKSSHEQILLTTILQFANSAENNAAGSFEFTIALAEQAFRTGKLMTPTTQTWRARSCHLADTLTDFCGSDATGVAKSALDASKGRSRLGMRIGEHSDNKFYIAKTSGHIFKLRFFCPFPVIVENARIFCYDGHIQDVSEIDRFLQRANAERQPLVIVARSFGDDLKQTSIANFHRGTLQLLLCEIPYDEAHVNSLYDVGTVTTCPVVDLATGTHMSSLRWEDFSIVKSCEIGPEGMTVFCDGSAKRTADKIRELHDKMLSTSSDGEAKVLKDRIMSLSPSRWDIVLPKEHSSAAMRMNIDRALRMTADIRKSGVVMLNDAEQAILGRKIMTGSAYRAAYVYANKLYEYLEKLSGSIIEIK